MNNEDRNLMAEMKLAIKELHKTVELIKTNDLPHILRKLGQVWTVVFFIVLPVLLIIFGSVIVKFIVE